MTAFDKARKLGAVILTNLGDHDGAKEAAVALIDVAAGATNQGTGGPADEIATAVPEAAPADIRRYLGQYQGRGAQQALIAWRDGKLMMLPAWPGATSRFGPAELRLGLEPGSLMVIGGRASGELARFEFDVDGEATAFRLAATVYRRIRISSF
jgi:hypothetical protein